MTAIRVTEPSGSNGAIQFANNGVFDTDAGLIFDTTNSRLGVGTATPGSLLHAAGSITVGSAATDIHHITGSLRMANGISGSLNHLSDGSSFLVAGSNVTITTASNGQVTVSGASVSAAPRFKTVYTITGSKHQSGISLTIAAAAFDSGSYNENRIDLFVNGQFMISGSNSDYTLQGDSTGVVFNFDLFQNDKVVSIVQ